jgi:gliding motility-associated-like protein
MVQNTQAQSWQWAKQSTCADSTRDMDNQKVVTDRFNNLYVGSGYIGDSICVGDNVFYNKGQWAPYNEQAVVAKYDRSGNLLWAHANDWGNCVFLDVATDESGNLYELCMAFSDSISLGSYSFTTALSTGFVADFPCLLIKYNSDGTILWMKNIGSMTNVGPAWGHLATDRSGNIYLEGTFYGDSTVVGPYTIHKSYSADYFGAYLSKIDSNGNMLWAKLTDDINYSNYKGFTGIVVSDDNYIYINSSVESFIKKLDTDGNEVWSKAMPLLIWGGSITIDKTNDIYIGGQMFLQAGETVTIDSAHVFSAPWLDSAYGIWCGFLIKYDSSGNILNAKCLPPAPDPHPTISSTGQFINNNITAVVADSCNNVWISGQVYATLGIRLDPKILVYAPPNSTDPFFMAEYDSYGNLMRYELFRSETEYRPTSLAADNAGNIYLGGTFDSGSLVLGDIALTNSGVNSNFVAKYAIDTLSIKLDTTVCVNASVTLHMATKHSAYLWDNGSQDSVRVINTAGTYWLTSYSNCSASVMTIDTITVANNDALCDCNAFLPDAFTPNNDGENDTYHPVFQNGCYIRDYSFSVYNRWGQRVFYSEDQGARWDGRFSGNKAEMGTYMYQLTYSTESGIPKHTVKGTVMLIR